jgi:excisionase family DNA binding protein
MQLINDDNDLDSAFYVVQDYISRLGADAKLPAQVADWCLKVRLTWETSASAPESASDVGQLDEEPYTVAEAAFKMKVTAGHVRRLARKGDIRAKRYGRDWLIPADAVEDWRGKWSK